MRTRPAHALGPARVLVVLVALLAAACGGTTPAADDTEDPSARDAAIRAARAAVREPAEALGTVAVGLAADVRGLRLGEPPDPSQRAAAADAVADGLAQLEAAADAAEGLKLEDDDVVAVAAARRALDQAASAAADLVEAAREDVSYVRELIAVDEQLAGVVAGWEEPGSRTQQIERFDQLEQQAAAIGESLADATERPPCATATQRRRAAATAVTTASAELGDLVAGYAGEAFGARLNELRDDPYGIGTTTLGERDGADADCWADEAPVVAAEAAVVAALRSLESALNPSASAPTPVGPSTG